MPVAINRRFLARSGARQMLRAAMASSAATIMLGGVGVSIANAQPAPTSLLCGFSSPGDDSGAEVDAIKQLKASYFSNVDAKNWTALRELLAPDVTVDTTCSAGPILIGRDPFIAFLQLTLGGATTHHQGYDPHVKLTSATTAEALWTMEDVLVFGGTLGVHGYGHYSDRYTKVNGKWVVKYSKLTRTRFDLTNPDGTMIQADAPLADVVAKVKAATGQ
ncbi:nuclear transport factor 2 family protein [Mycobacterium sp.]|uniref:nuclear transport factor 2 family protein n=1 Tax=Mycobacterium sp. TaxID=1785 RepID=UPI002D842B88|nr:nuclear transport factor 2 family protein [Mycobacterium sp.]